MSRPIALLTDFGTLDAYVGAMKGAILSRNPRAVLVDLAHLVPPGDIRRGAFLLATSVHAFPSGTVFLGVVDPGVGTERAGLAISAGPYAFVGPDNGLFAWALRFLAERGEVSLGTGVGLTLESGGQAVRLTERRFWRPEVSSTFHGRDIFGPVAAELSLGRSIGDLGPPLGALVDLPWPEVSRQDEDTVVGQVVEVDGYGNLVSNLRASDLPDHPTFEIMERRIIGLSPHFQSNDEVVALLGSAGFVELAAPNGSAAQVCASGRGTPIQVRSGARLSDEREASRDR